jgi:hypothetical protein
VEMGRELRWREYPTDERGSYFRQFWDVKGLIDDPAKDAHSFKDVKPIHEWELNNGGELGTHPPQGNITPKEPLVLAIRGALIQAFPNSMIYAVKAFKDNDNKGIEIDFSGTPYKLKLNDVIVPPIFGGKIEPDITLKGFNLSYAEVCGKDGGGDFGYFFIIKEVAGELRFGLDVAPVPVPQVVKWNDLSWGNIMLSDNNFVDLLGDDPNKSPKLKDVILSKEEWGSNSAFMANILSQKPVMIAIHAREMLKNINKPQ